MRIVPGTKLGPYEIESSIGAGGMDAVYRARDTRLNRPVAIKLLSETVADPYTPDGKRMVFDRLRENSDVVLIDRAR